LSLESGDKVALQHRSGYGSPQLAGQVPKSSTSAVMGSDSEKVPSNKLQKRYWTEAEVSNQIKKMNQTGEFF
jgi:hypothetical protein